MREAILELSLSLGEIQSLQLCVSRCCSGWLGH